MPFATRSRCDWKLRTRTLALGTRTAVMGVVNTTPDSFSDGGLYPSHAAAIEAALAMFDEGADIVDIGGESTRPGKREPVSAGEEIDRVVPVIEGVLGHRPQAILSIDTYKSATAAAALHAGVEIVNDVSAFLWDGAMARICAEASCGVVLMHTRGRPEEWYELPPMTPKEVASVVRQELRQRLEYGLQVGIEREHIVLDPGFGFGKVYEENYSLLVGLEQLGGLGRPLLAGVSRKNFLGRTLSSLHRGQDAPAGCRANASLAAATAIILGGTHVVRTHEVRSTKEAAAIADAILAAGEQ